MFKKKSKMDKYKEHKKSIFVSTNMLNYTFVLCVLVVILRFELMQSYENCEFTGLFIILYNPSTFSIFSSSSAKVVLMPF